MKKTAGVHVSNTVVRYVALEKGREGYALAAFGRIPIAPEGIKAALARVRKETGASRAHVAVDLEEGEALPKETAAAFAAAGMRILSVAPEADAAARAVLLSGDGAVRLVVDASGIGADAAHAARMIDRHLVRRHRERGAEREAAGARAPAIESIVLVGEHADITALADSLSAALRIKVSVGDAWTNLLRPANGVADLPRAESLAYAAAIGAALLG